MFEKVFNIIFFIVYLQNGHLYWDEVQAASSFEGDDSTTHTWSFKGSYMKTRRGRLIQAYRGIKYAEPPIGELRFQPPIPIFHYSGEVDATKDGPGCPQPPVFGIDLDEDCLTINVYTPDAYSNELLPVIVYIHSGGFYSLTGRSDFAGPQYLLDNDVVLVTLNYRLGVLGFLSMDTELAPGNNGYKDQVAALKWVQLNIADFGGDPNLVTIAGCSAGSLSVMLHMISPMSKGLFHRAISMSGSPVSKVPSPSNRLDLVFKQANIVNCSTDDLTDLYYCLKSKPWQELTESIRGFFEFGYDPLSLWRPIVEPDFGQERFMPIEPMDAIREGKMYAVPFIISMTKDEFFWKAFIVLRNQTLIDTMNKEWDRIAPISFILPRENATEPSRRLRRAYLGDRLLANDTQSAYGLGKLYGDALTAFPVHRMANLWCRHSPQPVYYYGMEYLGTRSHYEDPKTKKPIGVAHHDDLLYIFGLTQRFPIIEVSDSNDSKMVDLMTGFWYNFAKYGNPNYKNYFENAWPPMTPSKRSYLLIDKELSVQENLYEERFNLWDELYPIQY